MSLLLAATFLSGNGLDLAIAEPTKSTLYCAENQTSTQCKKMMRFNSREKVKQVYEKMDSIYCDEETKTGQAECRRIFERHKKSGCLTDVFIRDFLFQGTPEEYYRKKPEQRTYDYFANCSGDPEYVVTFCKCGCFEKSTEILVESSNTGARNWTPLPNVVRNPDEYSLLSLDGQYEPGEYAQKVPHSDFNVLFGRNKHKEMVEIHTKKGRTIKLTHDHPVLTSDAKIILAKDVTAAVSLVDYEGYSDPVLKVIHSTETVDVYNIGSSSPIAKYHDHLIFANELIVGDMALQQAFVSEKANIAARSLAKDK